MRRGVFFVPFLLYLAAEALVFALLWGFANPAVSWFMVPLLTRSFGEPATHYPNNLLVFPAMFTQVELVLGLLWGTLLFAAASYLFAAGFGAAKVRLGEALARARACYPQLVLSQIPATILAAGVLFLAERHIATTAGITGNAIRLYRYGGFFLSIVFQALFAFAMVQIVFERVGLARALGRSVRLASRNAIGCLLLVGIPSLMHYPASAIVRRAPLLLERGAPEMLALVTAADVLVGFITNYLWLGGITRFYLAGRRGE
jgi:hypothetical protein